MTNLVMSRISYENEKRIYTFQEIVFGYRTVVTNFAEKGCKLIISSASQDCAWLQQFLALEISANFDTLRCWLSKIKHWMWCCTTFPNMN